MFMIIVVIESMIILILPYPPIYCQDNIFINLHLFAKYNEFAEYIKYFYESNINSSQILGMETPLP